MTRTIPLHRLLDPIARHAAAAQVLLDSVPPYSEWARSTFPHTYPEDLEGWLYGLLPDERERLLAERVTPLVPKLGRAGH